METREGVRVELADFMTVHYAGLLRTAFLLTGDRHAAEDLVQEGLTRSWARAQRTTLEQPGAYVRRCMVNVFLTQRRRRLLVQEDPTDIDTLVLPPGREEPDRTGEVVNRETLRTVIRLLPRQQRVILVLKYYDDLSETQIADLLGIGVGSVRSSAWRGLERLRQQMPTDVEENHV